MTTIQELARDAARCFEQATRRTNTAGPALADPGETFTRLKDGSPAWVQAIVREAHGSMLPDDWRYQAIAGALQAIAETADDDLDDVDHVYADDAVNVYTHELAEWLGSHNRRPGYCDDANEELGTGDDRDILDRIRLGQYWELREVCGLVMLELEHRQAELAFDEADAAGETLAAYAPGHEPAELPGEADAAAAERIGDPPYSNAGGSFAITPDEIATLEREAGFEEWLK